MGYGTQTPQSITGKAIGGFCAIVGVFILTLPVPIVVNSFASYYKNRLWRNEVAHKRSVRAAEQAELVKELFVNSRRPSLKSQNSNRDDDGKFSLQRAVNLSHWADRQANGLFAHPRSNVPGGPRKSLHF